jgi:hypothetical protein
MSAPFKRCSCGASLSEADWRALPFVGVIADEVESIELRNHDCGSTIAVELQSEAAE